MDESSIGKDKAGNKANILLASMAILVFSGMAGVAAKYCAGTSISMLPSSPPEQPYSSRSTSIAKLPSENQLSFFEIAGLNIKLPSRPALIDIDLPPELRSEINAFNLYEVDIGSTILSVVQIIYSIPEASLDGAVEGSISEVRNLPGVDSFASSIESLSIDSLPARQVTKIYRMSGHSMSQYGLYFAQGNVLWHVQVISDGSASSEEVEALRDEIFSSISLVNGADSGDVAMFRGNLERTGVYPDGGPVEFPDLVWSFKSEGAISSSSPVVSGDAVYFGSLDGHLYAANIMTGQEKWRLKTGGRIDSSPTVSGGAVYFGSDDGYLYKLK